jgi:DNA-binding GntR family transcriptional regulator
MNGTSQYTQLPPVPGCDGAGIALMPLLQSIVDGTLVSGDELHAHATAFRLGLSEIDVDDAIPRLEHLGLIAPRADGPARMTEFTRDQAAREVGCWAEVHLALIAGVRLRGAKLLRMQRARDAFAASLATGAPPNSAAHFAFFSVLCGGTRNFGLQLAAASAAYRLRLSERALPHDPRSTSELHDAMLAALRSDDVVFDAEYALRTWSGALTGSPLGW